MDQTNDDDVKYYTKEHQDEKVSPKRVWKVHPDETSLELQIKPSPHFDFEDAEHLTLLDLTEANKLTSVGLRAFCNCSSLQMVRLTPSITEIGNEAFQGCTWLGAFNFESLPNLRTIGANAFGFTAITDVKLGESVEMLMSGCFQGCNKLSHVQLNRIISAICHKAFWKCGNLEHVNFHEATNLKEIGSYAFGSCH